MLILSYLRNLLKKHSALLLRPFGLHLLSKRQTVEYLTSQELAYTVGKPITLNSIPNLLLDKPPLFAQQVVTPADTRIWHYANTNAQAQQLPNGSLRIDRKVLNTDFGNGVVIKDWLMPRKRSVRVAKVLIAPWSHYWTGYYDYVFFVALKLCRIKNTLSAAEFKEAVLCYPLSHTSYERDILALFGFGSERIIDSRLVNVQFDSCILGSNENWFYGNEQDIFAFKQLVEAHMANHLLPAKRQHNRIYVRRAGRRKILNEQALLQLLQQYDFQIIDDVPRTLLEQVQIYYNAGFIIGPHGAAFTNILWCQPGAQLFELFPNTYMPDYFRYLAQVLGIAYSAYCHTEPAGSDHVHVEDDIYVDIYDLSCCLDVALTAVV